MAPQASLVAAGTGDHDLQVGMGVGEPSCSIDQGVEAFAWDQAADTYDKWRVGIKTQSASGRSSFIGVERHEAVCVNAWRHINDRGHIAGHAGRFGFGITTGADDQVGVGDGASQQS